MDAMCGSGTLPIEAALIATDTAPGIHRRYFGFLGWKGHERWKPGTGFSTRPASAASRTPKSFRRIVGLDRDLRAVRVALANVERAGLCGIGDHIEEA